MKRISCIILALLMLLLAACTPGQEETAEPTANATAAATAEPGEPSARPTLDPARQAFDPYTDYDNRYAALIRNAIVETGDAYYLYANGYIMYYDRIAEESGFLCPRPECEHDEVFDNMGCSAYAPMILPSFTFYEGRLWWVGYPDLRHFGIYRMELDGTNRELLHTYEFAGQFQGMYLWYFHRGRLYWSSIKQEVTDGMAFNTAGFGYIGLDDFEPHVLCERYSYFTPQPTIRFAGDNAYFFVGYDGIGPGGAEIPDYDTDPEGYLAWRDSVRSKDEILRWDPSMDEPETVYLNDEMHCLQTFTNAYVTQDGELFFGKSELEDPDREWDQDENPYIWHIFRVGADGKPEHFMELTDEDGRHYSMIAMTGGVIVAMDVIWGSRVDEIRGIWLVTFEGETLYRGELPMQYREKYTGERHGLSSFYSCWATRDELLFCFEERYYKASETHGDSTYYDFIKYEITPDGLVEIPLAECRDHYADEGW